MNVHIIPLEFCKYFLNAPDITIHDVRQYIWDSSIQFAAMDNLVITSYEKDIGESILNQIEEGFVKTRYSNIQNFTVIYRPLLYKSKANQNINIMCDSYENIYEKKFITLIIGDCTIDKLRKIFTLRLFV